MTSRLSLACGRITLAVGDCLDRMAELPDASISACITDPPYGLTQGAKGSVGFMGCAWDGGVPPVEVWREVFRVVKPGAHVLAFGGTRTYHRLVCAIEDAGFEIRDQIGWAFGTGFPKSLNVSAAIEKRRTEDVEPIRAVCRFVRARMDELGLKSRNLTGHFGDCNPRLIDHWAARDTDSQPSLPTPAQWETLKAVLGLGPDMDSEVSRLNARKGEHGDTYKAREVVGEVEAWSDRINFAMTTRDGLARGGAVSPEAAAWEGWGTSLKPSWEPICVARKPLDGSVSDTVLGHGTGALNIDACRVPHSGREGAWGSGRRPGGFGNVGAAVGDRMPNGARHDLGRWPANLIHDGSGEVLSALPDGAARIFFCAKASRRERGEGNTHPTVKPLRLMRYLVRLVTPPGGIVLDPFAGSGTTGLAAAAEGFRAFLCEREPEYAEIARRRIVAEYGRPAKRRPVPPEIQRPAS